MLSRGYPTRAHARSPKGWVQRLPERVELSARLRRAVHPCYCSFARSGERQVGPHVRRALCGCAHACRQCTRLRLRAGGRRNRRRWRWRGKRGRLVDAAELDTVWRKGLSQYRDWGQ